MKDPQGDVAVAEDDGRMEECCLGESIWELPAYVGLPGFGGCFATTFLILMLVLSCVIQGFMCHTLLTSAAFSDPNYWVKQRQAAEVWRLTDGHDSKFASLTGDSLVSRLCSGDGSLSVSSSQSELFGSITNYLNKPDMPWWSSTGPQLAMVCIVLFIVMIMDELRSLFLALRALISLPIGNTTIEDNRLAAISKSRLAASLVTSLMRFAVSVAVLWSGLRWLSNTSKAADLILNAAALGFVFSVDEMLMAAFVPAETQNRLRGLGTVKLRRLPLHLEALLPLILTVVIAAAAGMQFLAPQTVEMAATRRALCDGRRGFTVSVEQELVMTHQYTSELPSMTASGLRVEAVAALRDSPVDDLSFFRQLSIGQRHGDYAAFMTARGGCFEIWDVPQYRHAVSALQDVTGISRSPFSCGDYLQLCNSDGPVGPVVRLMCPKTCGCMLGPESGLLFTSGCPDGCLREGRLATSKASCTGEEKPTGLQTWGSALLQLARFNLERAGLSEERVARALGGYQEAFEEGCSAPGLAALCSEGEGLLAYAQRATTLHRFCPQLCCNGNFTDPNGICPPSCPV